MPSDRTNGFVPVPSAPRPVADDDMVEMSSEDLAKILAGGGDPDVASPPPPQSLYDDDVEGEVKATLSRSPSTARRELLEAIEELDGMLEAAPTPDLLEVYHAAAAELLDLGELTVTERCWRRSLEIFPDNPAVRERLSATLRMGGRLREGALELLATIRDVEDENASDKAWLYLDLGALLERVAPLPGTGPNWDVGTGICPVVRIGGNGIVPSGKDTDGRAAKGFLADIPKQRQDGKPVVAPKKKVVVFPSEDLSAELCYRRAIELDPENGEAHKRLADCLAVLGGGGRNADVMEEALREFEAAAKLMPHDICCATHALYGSPDGGGKDLPALLMTPGRDEENITLDALCWNAANLVDDASASDAADAFERHGVLVLPRLLSSEQVDALTAAVRAKSSAADEDDDGDSSDGRRSRAVSDIDYTVETREPAKREHRALPLSGDADGATVQDVVGATLATLHPVLSRVLRASGDGNGDDSSNPLPLLGAGYMRVDRGARRQELHKDVHHYDRYRGPVEGMPPAEGDKGGDESGGPRTVSVQIQLTDTSRFEGNGDGSEGDVGGSLEVLPGSHRPDGANGHPDRIGRALKKSDGVVPIVVPPGTVTIYSSRLWHRGGENATISGNGKAKGKGSSGDDTSAESRLFCFLTVTEPESAAPPGLIHTMELEDVGRWIVTEHGLDRALSGEVGAIGGCAGR